MQVIKGPTDRNQYVTDGISKRHLTPGELADQLAMAGQKSARVVGQFTVDRMPIVQGLP